MTATIVTLRQHTPFTSKTNKRTAMTHLGQDLWNTCEGITGHLKDQNTKLRQLYQQTETCERETQELMTQVNKVSREIDQLFLEWEDLFSVGSPRESALQQL